MNSPTRIREPRPGSIHIDKDENGKFVYSLKDGTGAVRISSRPFSTKQKAIINLEAVKYLFSQNPEIIDNAKANPAGV